MTDSTVGSGFTTAPSAVTSWVAMVARPVTSEPTTETRFDEIADVTDDRI
jgi:hypothetical protein